MKSLAVRLTAEFGEGFTAANLFNMRQFYLTFPKFYALRRELSWAIRGLDACGGFWYNFTRSPQK